MCGIAGFVGFNNNLLLKKMLNSIKHRGPDGWGVYADPKNKVSIGNRRLAIIDIKTGQQPIHNENKTMWIVFNGEIYNYQELTEKLKKMGHKFYTKSDTEMIIHAYEEWGEKCLNRFNGMWGLAIFDSKKRELFLARDRFGVKNIYYYWDGDSFLFASEIKALLQHGLITRIPNNKIIYDYLVHGIVDHTEETFFKGIKRIMPGHCLIVGRNGVKLKKYWDMPKLNKKMTFSSKNDEKCAKKLYELLEDAVRMRLISEVPVGTCLSGGIDSSSIVSIINRLLFSNAGIRNVIGERQKTFSAVYDNEEVDEREYIDEIVKNTGVEKNYVFPSAERLWKEIKKIVYYQDEPFCSTSIYAQWNVMRVASKKVKVLLDGQGADELLAGYLPYCGIFLFDLMKRKNFLSLTKEVALSFDTIMFLLPQYLGKNEKTVILKEVIDQTFLSKYRGIVMELKNKSMADILYDDFVRRSIPQLLRYEDRNSMAFSIEARVPFLDYRIVKYLFSLPVTQKVRDGWTKFVLRNALKGVVPGKIRKRRTKIGFETPEYAWLIQLRHEIRKVFSSKKFGRRKYFNQKNVLREFDEFCKGNLDQSFSRIFWRLLNLEIWFEVFIDR